MTSRRLAWFVLPLVAAIAVSPLLRHGCSCGHDFDFHLLNWLEAAQQFRHGNFHPQWAVTPAWNAGEPRFAFYPPLSWTIGALLTLAATLFAHVVHLSPAAAFAATPIAYTWLVLLAGGLSLFRVARPLAGEPAALVAATIYTINAYALFTAYERTAFAELLSMTLFPALFAVMLPPASEVQTGFGSGQPASSSGPDRKRPNAYHQPRITALAIVVALLWLSNAPAAVMGCYTLALLATLRLALPFRKGGTWRAALTFAARTAAGTLLGLALAAFFLLPALVERPLVQLNMAVLPGMRPEDNTLFHHTGDAAHDAVLHSASVIALLLSISAAFALVGLALRARANVAPSTGTAVRPSPGQPTPGDRSTDPTHTGAATLLAVTAAVILLLLTPATNSVWRHLPDLAFLQFPWRLLAEQACIVALLLALALRGLRLRPLPLTACCLALSLALVLPAYHTFQQTCYPEDTPQARFTAFTSTNPQDHGSEPTDEYTPATADNDSLSETNPPFRLLAPTDPSDAPPPPDAPSGPAPHTLDLTLSSPMLLILNLRDYPTWIITRNDVPITTNIARSDGLLTVALPAGVSHLRIRLRAAPSQRLGEITSLVALGTLALIARRERKAARRR